MPEWERDAWEAERYFLDTLDNDLTEAELAAAVAERFAPEDNTPPPIFDSNEMPF